MKSFFAVSNAEADKLTEWRGEVPTVSYYNSTSSGTVVFIVLACIALSIGFGSTLYSLSVDVAHHYALVATIMKDWRVGPEFLPNLSEMNHYPNLSHWLAAMIGGLVDTGIVGMTVLTIVSLTIIWSVVGLFLRELGLFPALIGGGILVYLVSHFGFRSVHGNEIIGNFFFAQLIGETGFYIVAWCLFSLHRRGLGRWADILVPLLVYFIAWAHLLPALKLVALFGLLTAVELFQARRARRTLPWSAVVSVIVAGTIVLKHPSYAAMKMIAGNDGALDFQYPSQIGYLVGIDLLLLLISVLFIGLAWRSTDAFRTSSRFALGIVGCMGAASAALMLLQASSLIFTGAGSLYAVKKHMFGVHSLLLIEMTLLFMLLVRFALFEMRLVARPVSAGGGPGAERTAMTLLPGLLAVAIVLSMMPSKGMDIIKVLPYQRFAANYMAFHSDDAGENRTVFLHEAMPSVINYLISIADIRHPRDTPDATDLKILYGQRFIESDSASVVITNPGNASYDRSECRVGSMSNSTTVVVNQKCVRKLPQRPVEVGQSFEFSTRGFGAPFLRGGWSTTEAWGTWSQGQNAEIQIPPPASGQPFSIELEANGFQPDGADPITVSVRLAGEPVSELRLGASDVKARIDIPEKVASSGLPIQILFDIANPRSPQEYGVSVDGRVLGIGLKRITYLK